MLILLLGMTRKWTGAWGETSLKATHWSSWWRNSAGMEPSRILSNIVPGAEGTLLLLRSLELRLVLARIGIGRG